MAVTLNTTTSSAGPAAGTNTKSIAYTIGAGSSLALRLAIEYRDHSSAVDPAFVSNVTIAGFSGTPTFQQLVFDGVQTVEVWSATGGAPGTYSAQVDWSTLGGPALVLCLLGVHVLNNVDQSTPVASKTTASGAASPITATLGSTVAGAMVCAGTVLDNVAAATITIGGGATQDWNTQVGAALGGRIRCAGSHIAAGGSITMSWTISAARAWVLAIEEWKEAATGAVKDILRRGIVAAPR